jgi:hypothetical protein
MESCSATKKNEILSFASKWMVPENIILSEVRQVQKAKKLHVLPHMWIIDQNKCSNIFGHGSHTKWRMCMGGIGKGKET